MFVNLWKNVSKILMVFFREKRYFLLSLKNMLIDYVRSLTPFILNTKGSLRKLLYQMLEVFMVKVVFLIDLKQKMKNIRVLII